MKDSPPATGVGIARSVRVPSPSSPELFEPQQYASPEGVRPHTCLNPAETEACTKSARSDRDDQAGNDSNLA